ncbi:MAG: alpha/beta hydrolase [Oscillospiraceae bacterium]|nr:alpha/beta hydrolase [Oscillospiraceae bacterium]
MNEQTLKIGDYTLHFYPCEDKKRPVFYLQMDDERAQEIASQMAGLCTLICIEGTDWNRDLSPWKAEKVFRQGEDFAGGGPEYLEVLTKTLIPKAEEALGFVPEKRGIGGYSLGGLFALWAGYESALFTHIASVSGSLWFDGFLAYALSRDLKNPDACVCLSLGDAEHKSRNARMAQVKDCTEKIAAHLSLSHRVISQQNPGNHFNDPEGRIIRALKALCKI